MQQINPTQPQNEEMLNPQPKSNTLLTIVISVLGTAIVVGAGMYFVMARNNSSGNQQALEKQIEYLNKKIEILESQKQANSKDVENKEQENQDIFADWQIYSNTKFTYKCPTEWSLNKNVNYNGQVELSECSKIYSGKFSFDDGVSVSFGFVPQNVADTYEWAGEKWSDTLLNGVKNESNAQNYANNNFVGWISMKNQKHTLKLIARHQVGGGYYELSADAVGDTKTDTEFKKMIDDIISTFEIR